MGQEIKDGEKKISPIEKHFFSKMTVEERKAWHEQANVKRRAAAAKRKKAKEDLRQRATAMLPQLLAEEMLLLEKDNYSPTNHILEKVRGLLDDPKMTLEKLRRTHFREMTEKGWGRLMQFLFKDQVASEADLGNQLMEQRKEELFRLDEHIAFLEKEIKLVKKSKKKAGQVPTVPFGLLQIYTKAKEERRNYRLDVSKNIFDTNLKTKNQKASASIHIHTTVPRPDREIKTVEIPVQKLDDLVNGD